MDSDEYEPIDAEQDEESNPSPANDGLTDDDPVEAAERIYRRVREAVIGDTSTVDEDALPAPRWERWWRRRHQFMFAGAFLTPFVVLGLMWFVAARLDTDDGSSGTRVDEAPSPGAATLAPDGNFARHTIPAIIRNAILTLNASQGYQFEGSAGDTWLITVEALDTLDPQARLYDPRGNELAFNDDQYPGSLSAELRVTLPADGAYRLLVESAPKSGGSTGRYLLSLFPE